MFFLPSGTKEAVWMSQVVSSTENNLWIGSYSDQGVFAFWGESRLARGKLLKKQPGITNPFFFREKLKEKLEKGFKVAATFQNDQWTADPDPKEQLPESLPNLRTICQSLVDEKKVLQVEFDDISKFEILNLYQITGKEFVGDELCPDWRLDHYIDSSQIYYQTRFDSPDDAVEVMKKMLEKRQKAGKGVNATGDPLFRGALAGRLMGNLVNSRVRPLDRKDLVLEIPDYAPQQWFY
jgi:hypothetical protein